ncbi:MAG: hypothetical protein AB7I30_23205 [Isosphaeraceae bacterium]
MGRARQRERAGEGRLDRQEPDRAEHTGGLPISTRVADRRDSPGTPWFGDRRAIERDETRTLPAWNRQEREIPVPFLTKS